MPDCGNFFDNVGFVELAVGVVAVVVVVVTVHKVVGFLT